MSIIIIIIIIITIIDLWLEPRTLLEGDNAVNFGYNEAMLNVKLDVAVIANVLCFALKVRYEFLY